jgi:hypothetical protein
MLAEKQNSCGGIGLQCIQPFRRVYCAAHERSDSLVGNGYRSHDVESGGVYKTSVQRSKRALQGVVV